MVFFLLERMKYKRDELTDLARGPSDARRRSAMASALAGLLCLAEGLSIAVGPTAARAHVSVNRDPGR